MCPMNQTEESNAAWEMAFDQGYICALVSFYGEFPAFREQVVRILSLNGFDTFEEVAAVGVDEYDMAVLREIYGVDDNDEQ